MGWQVPQWLTYDFPPAVKAKVNRLWGGEWHGQAQKWWVPLYCIFLMEAHCLLKTLYVLIYIWVLFSISSSIRSRREIWTSTTGNYVIWTNYHENYQKEKGDCHLTKWKGAITQFGFVSAWYCEIMSVFNIKIPPPSGSRTTIGNGLLNYSVFGWLSFTFLPPSAKGCLYFLSG